MQRALAPTCDRLSLLGEQIGFFLADPREGRCSVGQLAARLLELGLTFVFGGMPRELLLGEGYDGFRSDVDLVLDAPETPELRRLLASQGARRNRLGGWALGTAWPADLWLLERTWAHTSGQRHVRRPEDLLGTTFFNWDAILYEVGTGRVMCGEGYVAALDARCLDINLAATPNRLGNCVRALRYAARWDATMTPRLARFVLDVVSEEGVAGVLAKEKAAFEGRQILDRHVVEAELARLPSALAA